MTINDENGEIKEHSKILEEVSSSITNTHQKLEYERFTKADMMTNITRLRLCFNELIDPVNSVSNMLKAMRLNEQELNQTVEEIIQQQEENESLMLQQLEEEKKTFDNLVQTLTDNKIMYNKEMEIIRIKMEEHSKTVEELQMQMSNLNTSTEEEKLKNNKEHSEALKKEIETVKDKIKEAETEKNPIEKDLENDENIFLNETNDLNYVFDEKNDNLRHFNDKILTLTKQLKDQITYNESVNEKINLVPKEDLIKNNLQIQTNTKLKEEYAQKEALIKSELDELIEARNIREKLVNEIKPNIKIYKNLLENILEQVDVTMANNNQLANETKEVTIEIEKCKNETNTYTKGHDDLITDIQEIQTNVDILKSNIENINAHFKAEEVSQQNQIEQMQQEINAYENTMEREIEELTNDLEQCKTTLNKQIENIDITTHLETKLKLLQDEHSELLTYNCKDGSVVRSLVIDYDVVNNEINVLKAANSAQKQKIAAKSDDGRKENESPSNVLKRHKDLDDMSVSSTEGIDAVKFWEKRRAKKLKKNMNL